MPDIHASIVRLVQQTCTDILCSTPGANKAVAPANHFDSAILDKTMTSAAELERSVPGSQRMLLKAYSSIAVLRYTIAFSQLVCMSNQKSYLFRTVLLQHTHRCLCQTARLSTCNSHMSGRIPCRCMAGHAIAAEHASLCAGSVGACCCPMGSDVRTCTSSTACRSFRASIPPAER